MTEMPRPDAISTPGASSSASPEVEDGARPGVTGRKRHGDQPAERLMFCLSDLGTGGTARATLLVANGLAASGHDVSLAVMRGGGVLTGDLDPRVTLIELRSGRPRGATMLLGLRELASVIRTQRPTHLISAGNHMHVTAVLAHAIAQSDARLSLKMTNSIDRRGLVENFLRRRFLRWAFGRVDRVMLITRSTREEFARTFPDAAGKLRVVDNPYITDAMLEAGRDPAFDPGRLIAIGRLVEQKNYPLLLDALARIRDLEWSLDILGDGPLIASLHEQAQRLGIADRVTFRGFVANPLPLLGRAHALVLSSAWEGQGAVLLEALACGCPVVATRSTAAVGEALGEGRYGTLVAPGDARALSEAVARELRQRSILSDDARAWVNHYRLAAGVQSHVDALGLARP